MRLMVMLDVPAAGRAFGEARSFPILGLNRELASDQLRAVKSGNASAFGGDQVFGVNVNWHDVLTGVSPPSSTAFRAADVQPSRVYVIIARRAGYAFGHRLSWSIFNFAHCRDVPA
jgi:hypothetical protein